MPPLFISTLRRSGYIQFVMSVCLRILQALAQDQRAALEQLLWACEGLQHIKVANYDGDTPMDHRAGISYAATRIHQSLTLNSRYSRVLFSDLH